MSESSLLVVAIILLALFVLPVVVYLCAKLGTLGYLNARRAFRQRERERRNGNAT